MAPGNARAKECLEEHRNDDGFSEDCRKELERMIELRVGDFRLDPIMREYCAQDVEAVGGAVVLWCRGGLCIVILSGGWVYSVVG